MTKKRETVYAYREIDMPEKSQYGHYQNALEPTNSLQLTGQISTPTHFFKKSIRHTPQKVPKSFDAVRPIEQKKQYDGKNNTDDAPQKGFSCYGAI